MMTMTAVPKVKNEGIDLIVAQDRRQIGVGQIEQLDQPVLYLDIIMAAREGEPGGSLQSASTCRVQLSNQRINWH